MLAFRSCGGCALLQSYRGPHRQRGHAGTVPHSVGRPGGCAVATPVTCAADLLAGNIFDGGAIRGRVGWLSR